MELKRSRRRHYYNGLVGYLVADERGHWKLLDAKGIRRDVDQPWARGTVAAEDAQLGRTSYFPGEAVESHTITLPADLWRKVRRPFSPRLAEILRGLREGA